VDVSLLLRNKSWRPGKENCIRSLTQKNTRWSVAHIVEALAGQPIVTRESKFATNAEGLGGLRKKRIEDERII